jgi:hypothetical protein
MPFNAYYCSNLVDTLLYNIMNFFKSGDFKLLCPDAWGNVVDYTRFEITIMSGNDILLETIIIITMLVMVLRSHRFAGSHCITQSN